MSISMVTRGRLWPVGTFVVREQFMDIHVNMEDDETVEVDMTLAEELTTTVEVVDEEITTTVEVIEDEEMESEIDATTTIGVDIEEC
jgi:hypothetical protein